MLMEVIVSEFIKQNVLLSLDIVNDIVAIDGGDVGNPPIHPPDGINWHCLSVSGGKECQQGTIDTCQEISYYDEELILLNL